MTYRTIRTAAWCAAPLIAILSMHAWFASRNDQQRLRATLASQKQLLDAADARQRARETALNETLAQIESLKRTRQTPEQIVRDLPKYLALPQPITLTRLEDSVPRRAHQGTGPSEESPTPPPPPSTSSPIGPFAPAPPSVVARSDLPSAPLAQIPAADLKHLYDFVQDCRACQARLATATQNALDDSAKIAALTRQRDAAITTARGGSFYRRLRRNTLWFVVGAAFGASAGYALAQR
jgi:hypothetical protein